MGTVESITAVATAVAAIIALGIKFWRDANAKKAQERSDSLHEISLKLENAKTDAERIEYAKQLSDLHSRK